MGTTTKSQKDIAIQEGIKERRENNRFRIRAATLIIAGYLIFILGAMVISAISLFLPIKGTVNDVKDIILTISAIFSGPLGLIIGYFYRADKESK
jgi:hypothetical protein